MANVEQVLAALALDIAEKVTEIASLQHANSELQAQLEAMRTDEV